MRGSLKTALQELDQAEKMLPAIQDRALYMAVDASHANPKSRKSKEQDRWAAAGCRTAVLRFA